MVADFEEVEQLDVSEIGPAAHTRPCAATSLQVRLVRLYHVLRHCVALFFWFKSASTVSTVLVGAISSLSFELVGDCLIRQSIGLALQPTRVAFLRRLCGPCTRKHTTTRARCRWRRAVHLRRAKRLSKYWSGLASDSSSLLQLCRELRCRSVHVRGPRCLSSSRISSGFGLFMEEKSESSRWRQGSRRTLLSHGTWPFTAVMSQYEPFSVHAVGTSTGRSDVGSSLGSTKCSSRISCMSGSWCPAGMNKTKPIRKVTRVPSPSAPTHRCVREMSCWEARENIRRTSTYHTSSSLLRHRGLSNRWRPPEPRPREFGWLLRAFVDPERCFGPSRGGIEETHMWSTSGSAGEDLAFPTLAGARARGAKATVRRLVPSRVKAALSHRDCLAGSPGLARTCLG